MKYSVIPVEDEYDFICSFSEGLALVRNNYEESKCGFIDRDGKLVIPMMYYTRIDREGQRPLFVHFPVFSEGLVSLLNKDGKFGFIDRAGNVAIDFIYDYATEFREGRAVVEKDGMWGCVDGEGKIAVPFEYEGARWNSFCDGIAWMVKNGKVGAIDADGNTVIPFEFDSSKGFNEGLASVEKDGEKCFIDRAGNVVLTVNIECWSVAGFCGGYAVIDRLFDEEPSFKSRKAGLIDRSGNLVMPIEYDVMHVLPSGIMIAAKDGNATYKDMMTGEPFPVDGYMTVTPGEELMQVQKDGNQSYIDRAGNVVLSLKDEYEAALPFREGHAAVRKNGKWGAINRAGELVIPAEYDREVVFTEGIAPALKDGKWYIIRIETDE